MSQLDNQTLLLNSYLKDTGYLDDDLLIKCEEKSIKRPLHFSFITLGAMSLLSPINQSPNLFSYDVIQNIKLPQSLEYLDLHQNKFINIENEINEFIEIDESIFIEPKELIAGFDFSNIKELQDSKSKIIHEISQDLLNNNISIEDFILLERYGEPYDNESV